MNDSKNGLEQIVSENQQDTQNISAESNSQSVNQDNPQSDEVIIERTQGQPFNIKRRVRSDVEQERPINLAQMDKLKFEKSEQVVVTINDQDIIVNRITPAQTALIAQMIFMREAEPIVESVSKELESKGMDLQSDEARKIISDERSKYIDEITDDIVKSYKFVCESKIYTCLMNIASPDWITEEVLRSWPEEWIDAIADAASEGVEGQDIVNAFPEGSENESES